MYYDNDFGLDYSSDELYHHGIKGQKWGVRRFQSYSTTGARKGGKKGKEIGLAAKAGASIKKFRQERAAKKAENAKIKQEKAAEAKKKRDEKLMADKERILREGSAGEVLSLHGKVTNQELRTAVDRINLEQQLAGIQAKQISEGKKLVNSIAGYVKTAADIAEGVSRIKNVADKFLENEDEKQRQNLINKGTPADIKKYGHKYFNNPNDYKNAINRIQWERQIDDFTKGKFDSGKKKGMSEDEVRDLVNEMLNEKGK